MKIQLVVSAACVPCDQAEAVWREVAADLDLDFSVVNLAEPEGLQLAASLEINTIPAVIMDGTLVAIGVQSPLEARALVADPPLPKHL